MEFVLVPRTLGEPAADAAHRVQHRAVDQLQADLVLVEENLAQLRFLLDREAFQRGAPSSGSAVCRRSPLSLDSNSICAPVPGNPGPNARPFSLMAMRGLMPDIDRCESL